MPGPPGSQGAAVRDPSVLHMQISVFLKACCHSEHSGGQSVLLLHSTATDPRQGTSSVKQPVHFGIFCFPGTHPVNSDPVAQTVLECKPP